jgi:hypothetical protein
MKIRSCLFAVVPALCISLVWAEQSKTPPRLTALARQRREVELQLLRERTALLSDDPEIAALNRRIGELYRQLEAAIAGRPGMKRLQARLEEIDREMADARR